MKKNTDRISMTPRLVLVLLSVSVSNSFVIPRTIARSTTPSRIFMSATEESKDMTDSTSLEDESLFVVASNELNETFRTNSHSSLTSNAQFGDSVSLKPSSSDTSTTQQPQAKMLVDDLKHRQTRSIVTAVLAVLLGVLNYAWQYTHPMSSLQILTEMQSASQPLSIIGTNDKPTVVDFWAPWCENCKLAAPTLLTIEKEYSDRVNFCMINGDEAQAWPYIEAFRVDAIPHLALVSKEGDVETALIGPIPKSVLEADLNVMIGNAQSNEKVALPYRMLDVFRDSPDKKRVHFDP
mmetsp:Transcript_698/g.1299  ORF Transcript_698/g.1299 Transcript_698/m.1299 type:complete len:294 (+) Transcript_698:141-1022(+)